MTQFSVHNRRGRMTARSFSYINSSYARRLHVEALEDRRMLAIITVDSTADNTTDDGQITLREAVIAANNDAIADLTEGTQAGSGPDTIHFAPALSGQTIALAGTELAITSELTIDATVLAEKVVIDASGSDPTPETDNGDGIRIFNVDDGNSSVSIYVTIAGLSLTGGDTGGADEKGGAIFSLENLTITDSVISGNYATDNGGGIYAHALAGGETMITGSTISGNSSGDNGGGIQSRGTTTISYSSITDNSTVNNGGGIDTRDDLMIDHATISGNSAQRGGGIRPRADSTTTITDSTISDNHATHPDHGGGGISAEGTTMVIRTTVSDNTASVLGGGIENYTGNHPAVLYVIDSIVRDNSSGDNGGGIFGQAYIQGSTISGNYSGERGGGIYSRRPDSVEIINSTFTDNEADYAGGGVRALGPLTITGSLFSNNRAIGGGGGGIFGSEPTSISGSIISGNSAGTSGGGIFADDSISIIDSTISYNSITYFLARGGGIMAAVTTTLTNSTVSGNRVTGSNSRGGGIFVADEITLVQSTVTDNHATGTNGTGGGIWNNTDPITISGSILAGNTAGGGDPDMRNGTGTLTLNDSLIGDNLGTPLMEAPVGSPDANGNLIGGATNGVIDPLLGPLQDNGGPTQTHALLPGSPAIDAVDDMIPETEDQRGLVRIVGGVDMGAYEAQVAPSADFDSDSDVDGRDFLAWQRGYGITSGATRADGNSDDDGDVDPSDLAAWQVSFGQPQPLVASVSSGQEIVESGQSAASSKETLVTRATFATNTNLIDAATALSFKNESSEEKTFVENEVAVPNETARNLAFASSALFSTGTIADEDAFAMSEYEAEASETEWLAEELLERVFG